MSNQAILAGVKVGDGHPVRLMGVINLSPESFFRGSVLTQARALAKKAREMTLAGADFIDVGAMSSAPYLKTQISEEEEARRIRWALPIIKRNTDCPISVDTSRAKPALAALKTGGEILNDITGLFHGLQMAGLHKEFKGFILMANPLRLFSPSKSPIQNVKKVLSACLQTARRLKIPINKIVVDPGIGFFRFPSVPWWKWDIEILKKMDHLKTLGRPILVGLSRKSFIGHILDGQPPEKRLAGSLAATIAAVSNGAAIIRTHDVKETKEAILVAELLRKD